LNRKVKISLLLSLIIFITYNPALCPGEEDSTSIAPPECGIELLESLLPDGSMNRVYRCSLTFINSGEHPCSRLYNLTFIGIMKRSSYWNTSRHSILLNVSLGAGEVTEEHVEFLLRSLGGHRVTLDGEFLDYIDVDFNMTYDQDMIDYTNLTVTPKIVDCGKSANVTLCISNLDNGSSTAHFSLGLDAPDAPIALLYRGGHQGTDYDRYSIELEPQQKLVFNKTVSTRWPGYYTVLLMVNEEDMLSTGFSVRYPIEVGELRIEPSIADGNYTLTLSLNISNTYDFFVYERMYVRLDGDYLGTQLIEMSGHETEEVTFIHEGYSPEGSTGQAEVFLINSKKYLQGIFELEDEDEKPEGYPLLAPTVLVSIAALFIIIGLMKNR
jgi:hypothetical protein